MKSVRHLLLKLLLTVVLLAIFPCIQAVAIPSAPEGLTVTSGDAQVSLAWNAAPYAVNYNIYRGTASGEETLYKSGVESTSYTDVEVTNGTTYYYRVTGVNNGGQESQMSSEVSSTPIAPPGAPTGLTAAPGDANVSLAWNASAAAASYDLYRGTLSGGEVLYQTGLTSTSYRDEEVVNGTTYYYEVVAVNASGTSEMSSEVSATPVGLPAAPTGLTAIPGNGEVSLMWNASTEASSYNLYRGTAPGKETLYKSGLVSTAYTDKEVANETTYYYTVAAVNAAGISGMSSEVSAVPVGRPAAPTDLTAKPGNAQVSLAWNTSSGATSYDLYRGTASGGEVLYQSGLTSTSYIDTEVANGTTYYYKVAGENAAGAGEMSEEASATPMDNVKISGQVTFNGTGLSGVSVTSSDGGSTLTDSNGNYTITVHYGFTGRVTPSLAWYAFSPRSINYTNLTSNEAGQNYTAEPVTDAPWGVFRHDPQHTAQSEFTGPETPVGKWTSIVGFCVGSSPAIASDGTIYVGSNNDSLYALNPDGTSEWAFQSGGYLESSPAIASDGTIYVGSYDGNLYAVNPADGTEDWAFSTRDCVEASPVVGTDGTIYVGSDDGNLYAVNPSGAEIWAFQTSGWVYSSPALSTDGTIYFGSGDGNLYAVNPDGTKRWAFQTGFQIASSPAVGSDGTVYCGSDDGNLYAINPDGTEKWAFNIGNWVYSSPAIGADGTIYVGSDYFGSNNCYLYAINPDGSEKWAFQTGSGVGSSPAIGADGTVYVGSDDGNLYAINPDGSEKWAFQTEGLVYSSPVIGPDGTVYCSSSDGNFYAIGK